MSQAEEEDTNGDDGETLVNFDDVVDEMTAEEVEQVADSEMIATPEGEVSLSSVMADIVVAHEELRELKEASLAMAQQVKEARDEARKQGREKAASLLHELYHSARGIYLRLHRGDAELLGERDGKYSGYFEDDYDADN